MFNRKKNNRPLNYRRSFSNFARKQKNPINELTDLISEEVKISFDNPEEVMDYLHSISFNNGGSGVLYSGGLIAPKMRPLADRLYNIFNYWDAILKKEDITGIDFGDIPDVETTKKLIKKLGSWVTLSRDICSEEIIKKIFQQNDLDKIQMLIDMDFDFNKSLSLNEEGEEEYQGMTAFLYAVQYATPEVVEMLIEDTDADVDAQNIDGYGALEVALFADRNDLIDIIIEAGADIDNDYSGETPLIIAAKEGNLQAVKKLIEEGADPELEGQTDYDTPLEAAEGEGHTKVVSYLKRVLGNNGRRGRGRRR